MSLPRSLVFSSALFILNALLVCVAHADRDPLFLRHAAKISHILKPSEGIVDVDDYGAKGDGTDDSQAFAKTWQAACASTISPTFLVPASRSYLLGPITFSGPCRSNVSVMIKGTIQAPSDRSVWKGKDGTHWITFQGITNLFVGGGGTIDGSGKIWWQNSCKIDKSQPCRDAPTAITFYSCNNLNVEGINVKNSQQIHLSFEDCNGVIGSSITISAPEDSPNTDGIHITGSQNVDIHNCTIGTGDDCVSIVSGSQNVKARNIVCGPGHGISIGSLGADNSQVKVSNVVIDTATLTGTTNGLRIKTWQGGSGFAKDIVFQNIEMRNAKNPIIIDQNYCDSNNPCHEQKHAVKVSNVLYKNIKGSSASEVALTFNCSRTVPCQGIVLQDINLVGENGEKTKSACMNINWSKVGTVVPIPCAN